MYEYVSLNIVLTDTHDSPSKAILLWCSTPFFAAPSSVRLSEQTTLWRHCANKITWNFRWRNDCNATSQWSSKMFNRMSSAIIVANYIIDCSYRLRSLCNPISMATSRSHRGETMLKSRKERRNGFTVTVQSLSHVSLQSYRYKNFY